MLSVSEQGDAREQSKARLLSAALKLFSEQGVDAVSLRMINRDAGHRNNSALHYHFGTKLGLLDTLIGEIQRRFTEARLTALDAVEEKANAGEIELRDVMTAFIAPYLHIMRKETWGADAVRFVARLDFDGDPELLALLVKHAQPEVARFLDLIGRCLPDMPPKLMKQRLNFAINSTILALATHRNLKNSYLGDLSGSLTAVSNNLLDQITAAMAAPYKQTTRKQETG